MKIQIFLRSLELLWIRSYYDFGSDAMAANIFVFRIGHYRYKAGDGWRNLKRT